MSFTSLDSKLEPTRRDTVIMGLLKSGFWIVATENALYLSYSTSRSLEKRISRLPYKIISLL